MNVKKELPKLGWMKICSIGCKRPTAKELWKWAVARIIWLLKLRRKWAHISKSIFQHLSHQSLFDGLERRQGKLIRKKFFH